LFIGVFIRLTDIETKLRFYL